MSTPDWKTHCPWMLTAMACLWRKEVPGPQTADFISAMLKRLHAWWGDDETPWCGTFVAGCLQEAGLPVASQWWRARGWVGFGHYLPLNASVQDIPYGALVVLDRPPSLSNGHVGFYAGRADARYGRDGLVLLGGNQGDAVSYASFPRRRVIYWSWPGVARLAFPAERELITYAQRPLVAHPSTGEA